MVRYFVVITGTMNDVNNSSVIYTTSSKGSFASPVKLQKVDMSPLCSKQTLFRLQTVGFNMDIKYFKKYLNIVNILKVSNAFCTVR